jgi:hypothetical protein
MVNQLGDVLAPLVKSPAPFVTFLFQPDRWHGEQVTFRSRVRLYDMVLFAQRRERKTCVIEAKV